MKIAIIGIGNIGTGFTDFLQQQKEFGTSFTLSHVCSKGIEKQEINLPKDTKRVADYKDIIANPDIDIVVETIGGNDVALEVARGALKSGKHLVTANKMMIAENVTELSELADKHGVKLLFEASVCGGIQILKPLKEIQRLTPSIESISGIINGTSNFILTKMTKDNLSFDEALSKAQALGYAEPDPTFDINGFDIFYKACILHLIAYRELPLNHDTHVIGIDKIDTSLISEVKKQNFSIKQIAHIQKNGISVAPTLVHNSRGLSTIDDNLNSIEINTGRSGFLSFEGPGAGPYPTSLSIMKDVYDIVHDSQQSHFGGQIKKSSTENNLTFQAYAEWNAENAKLTIHNSPIELKDISNSSNIFPVLDK